MADNNKDFSDLGFVDEEEFKKMGFVEEPSSPDLSKSSEQDILNLDASKLTPEQIDEADKRYAGMVNQREIVDPSLAGLAQGSTFNFSDEMGGAKDAILGGPKDLYSRYRTSQQGRQAENKRLSEEYPLPYMGGELAGGLATAALVPELGTERLVSMAGKLSPRAAAFLSARAPAGALTKIAGKGVQGAIQGAPLGAAYGFGGSENTIEQPVELAKDTISSAKTGSLAGLGLSAAAQTGKAAIKKVGDLASDSKFLTQMGKAFKYGEEGKNLGSNKLQDQLSTLPSEYSQDMVTKIMSVDEDLGKAVGAAITNAQNSGVKINIDPELQASGQKIFKTIFQDNPTLADILDPKSAKLLQTISQKGMGDLTPVEAKAFRDELYSLSDKLTGYNSDQANFAKSQARGLASKLNQTLKEQIPEYQQASAQFEEFRRLVPETIISKGTPSQYEKTFIGDLKNPELKLYESSEDMLKHSQLPGTGVEAQRATMATLGRNMAKLEQNNPEAVRKLGGNAADVMSGLKNKSDELAMIRQSMGVEPHGALGKHATGQLFGFGSSVSAKGMSVANKLGIVSKGIKQSAPVKLAGSVFGAADDALRGVANRLKGSPATSTMGQALETALNNKNEVAKNAVLFKLMQEPDFRNMLREEGFDDGQEAQ